MSPRLTGNKPDIVEGVITVSVGKHILLQPDGDVQLVQISKGGNTIGLTIAQCQSLAKYLEQKFPMR